MAPGHSSDGSGTPTACVGTRARTHNAGVRARSLPSWLIACLSRAGPSDAGLGSPRHGRGLAAPLRPRGDQPARRGTGILHTGSHARGFLFSQLLARLPLPALCCPSTLPSLLTHLPLIRNARRAILGEFLPETFPHQGWKLREGKEWQIASGGRQGVAGKGPPRGAGNGDSRAGVPACP